MEAGDRAWAEAVARDITRREGEADVRIVTRRESSSEDDMALQMCLGEGDSFGATSESGAKTESEAKPPSVRKNRGKRKRGGTRQGGSDSSFDLRSRIPQKSLAKRPATRDVSHERDRSPTLQDIESDEEGYSELLGYDPEEMGRVVVETEANARPPSSPPPPQPSTSWSATQTTIEAIPRDSAFSRLGARPCNLQQAVLNYAMLSEGLENIGEANLPELTPGRILMVVGPRARSRRPLISPVMAVQLIVALSADGYLADPAQGEGGVTISTAARTPPVSDPVNIRKRDYPRHQR